MNLEMAIRGIELRDVSEKWITVAATKRFSEDEIIEICPLTILDQEDSPSVRGTNLAWLCFQFGDNLVVPGGYGSIYLPSKNPNAEIKIIPKQRAMTITAKKEIKPGEFILIDTGLIPFSEPRWEYNQPTLWHSDGLVVKPSPGRGLGTFTTQPFKEGDYVEVCYLHCLTEKESKLIAETEINGFMYGWGSKNQLAGWAVGYPCFYNHSDNPNIDPWGQIDSIEYTHLAVKALRDLEPGTELVFDYIAGYKNKDLGFEAV